MNEQIKQFLQKLAGDEALAAKLQACKSPDEAYALASSVAEGFTKEEFVSVMEQLKASAGNSAELSDEDLSKMAGGSIDIDWSDVGLSAGYSAVGASLSVVSAAAASAAAI